MYTTGLKRPWDAEAAAAHCMSERGSDSESDSNSQSEDREFLNASETCRDEDEEMGEVKEVLTNTLDSVTSIADTEWAFGNQMNRPPNPGLTLSNHGIVGLPLSALEAYRIRQEAILNKGSDKMVGSTVIGPNSFELRNPAWSYMFKLASKILEKDRISFRSSSSIWSSMVIIASLHL